MPEIRCGRHLSLVNLCLNRPAQFNGLSEELLATLKEELALIAADPSVRCVVLSAAGKAFCAGHDLRQMRANPRLDYYRQLFARCTEVMQTIIALPIRVIARVHGLATAAGCQLVASCDLAVARMRRASLSLESMSGCSVPHRR